ncbi:hypothetical protein DMUE_6242, partial [Dictyocoela muelleri]
TNIILGMEFLLNNEAKIDLKEKELELNGLKHEVETFHNKSEYEIKLEDETKIYKNSFAELPEDISKLLRFNTENIGSFGLIPDIEHKIKLIKLEIIAMKPYRISPIMKEKLKEEIKKLIMDNIIQKSNSKYASSAIQSSRRMVK